MNCLGCGKKMKRSKHLCKKCRKGVVPERVSIAYGSFREKRLSYDGYIWQAPTLCIAAQSFLYSIAFAKDSSNENVIITSGLAVILGLASYQLMVKHRFHERKVCDELEQMETKFRLLSVHSKMEKNEKQEKDWMLRYSSFQIWRIALILMTLAGSYKLMKEIAISIPWQWICDLIV